nr:hypothetical protein [Marseillevirus cajuinensis]
MSLDQNESHLQTVFDRRREEDRCAMFPFELFVFDFSWQEDPFSKPSWNKIRKMKRMKTL